VPDSLPELMLLPGLGLGREAWEPTISAAATKAAFSAVRVLPLPGYGLPADPGADLAPRALAEVVAARLREHGPAVLAGHSASCQVAAHAAALVPELVVGLAMVGPTTDPRAGSWPRLAARWLATAAHERPGQVPSLVRQYHRTTLATMARAMEAARRDPVQATLRAVRCPVVVVRGLHDRICPADWADSLAPTVTLPAGGHMVPLTHGRLVAEELARSV
jgi:pimeloyl-ACP methyl ester carboxylesterase